MVSRTVCCTLQHQLFPPPSCWGQGSSWPITVHLIPSLALHQLHHLLVLRGSFTNPGKQPSPTVSPNRINCLPLWLFCWDFVLFPSDKNPTMWILLHELFIELLDPAYNKHSIIFQRAALMNEFCIVSKTVFLKDVCMMPFGTACYIK